jgi:dTMP kinase
MKGKLITLEGIDGSGKSTQVKLLIDALTSSGVSCKFIHYPRMNSGHYGKLIAEYLRGEFGSIENVHPKLVALLFAEDRRDHKEQISSWLNEGHCVIMDRYVNSNIAFQCAKIKKHSEKKSLKEWILDLEFVCNKLPKPDISVFLDVSPDDIAELSKDLRIGEDREYLKGKSDIHESSIEFQKRVYQEYCDLFETVDCIKVPVFLNGVRIIKEEVNRYILEKILKLQ